MSNVVVIGSQWGDEGKGKIVDWLSSEADVVVRFQGGHNAGHTLVIDGVTYKLRLLPSGIVRKDKISIIGNGVVIDPWALLEEIEEIKSKGVLINSNNLIISESANLILPFHKEMDEIREDAAGKAKIGTTRRGIGPAYEDKIGRRSIRVMDLLSEKNLEQRLETVLLHHNAIRKGLGKKIYLKEKLKKDLLKIAPEILKFSTPVWLKIDQFKKHKKKILFEGAQGILLDVDHGTYPFVTSSNTVASSAATGSGCGPNSINYVLGITKAYTTRVGEGPFPTELKNETGEILGKRQSGLPSFNVADLSYDGDLLEEAKALAASVVRELRSDLDEEEINSIAEAVGVSAVRFNIVKVSPEKGITFRWEEALSFEGESAPFVMYSHTRACSIARKVGRAANFDSSGDIPSAMQELMRVMS